MTATTPTVRPADFNLTELNELLVELDSQVRELLGRCTVRTFTSSYGHSSEGRDLSALSASERSTLGNLRIVRKWITRAIDHHSRGLTHTLAARGVSKSEPVIQDLMVHAFG